MISLALTVRDLMIRDPVTVPPDQPVRDVLRMMNDLHIGAVVVAVEGKVLGIFTERDLLRQAPETAEGWGGLPVGRWMTRDPHSIDPNTGWEEAVARMERLRVRHLPVIENGRIIGIASARQLIARRSEHLNRRIEERTLELKRANALLVARDAEIRRNMEVAGRLHARLMLPSAPPSHAGLGWAIHYAPQDSLGGDYYDFACPDEQHIGILIADASGHSIPAAMVAIMARTAFNSVAKTTSRPGVVLAEMNRQLQGITDERFVTAFYGVLDRVTNRLTYASAGHPPPLRYDVRRGTSELLAARGFMLGILPTAVYEEKTIDLGPGDRLCFVTDGVIDSRDQSGEMFGTGHIAEVLAYESAPEVMLREILRRQAEFMAGRPAEDDQTILLAVLPTQ